MDKVFYFYIEANLVCIIISCILLFREIINIDKQLRNIEFLKTILVYIFFYTVDIIWALFQLKIFYISEIMVNAIYLLRLVVFAYGSYQWFIYSEVAQGYSDIYKKNNRLKWAIPVVLVFIIFLVFTILVSQNTNENLELRYIFIIHLFMIFTAFGYEVASSIKSWKRAYGNKKHFSRSWFIYMGVSPIVFSSFMILQIIFPFIPIFCFLNTIMMLCFYLKGIDSIISVDPLTKLNNRNQLKRYCHQLTQENGFINYVIVIDIDKFKMINDKFGHLEGDNALVLVSDTFREVCEDYPYKIFISRYGGDEFVFIVQAESKKDIEDLKSSINKKINFNVQKAHKPYELTISVGYSEYICTGESLESCLEYADKEMYLEKQEKYCNNN